jgi:hypothetical protein
MTSSSTPPSSDYCPVPPRADDDRDATFQTIQEAILGLWAVVNNLTRIKPPKGDRYRVTIFGSARLQPNSSLYDGVRHLASELTKLGCDIVTGGGPGLMQAANEGSVTADPDNCTQSIGIRVDLDFEQTTNPFVEKVYQHRTFFSRLHHFALLSDAFVVVPGGIGTTLEVMMVWQLLQVRQLHDTPLILVGPMWADLVVWANKHMVNVEPQLAAPVDLAIPRCVASFEDAVALLRNCHAAWEAEA